MSDSAAVTTRTGTIGGMLTIFLANISAGHIMETILLSAIGAIVGFLVSRAMKKLAKWWRAKFK